MSKESFFSKIFSIPEKRPKVPEVAELIWPIKNIIGQIEGRLEKGEYGYIIGDDASARIPVRILDRFVKEVYKDKGFDEIKTRFIAGTKFDLSWGGNRNDEDRQRKGMEMEIYLNEEFQDKERRILIVTDTLSSGDSLNLLCEKLRQLGYQYDLVTVGFIGPDFNPTDASRKHIENKLGADVYVGEKGLPRIYDYKEASGVRKDPRELHSHAIAKEFYGKDEHGVEILKDERGRNRLSRNINDARDNAFDVADELLEWYRERHPETNDPK